MRNYRRLSGDGSAKAVVSSGFMSGFTTAAKREPSPESNLPSTQQLRTLEFCTLHSKFCIERTTSKREPAPYNSSPTQELCNPPAIPVAFLRVPSPFQEHVDFQPEGPLTFQKSPCSRQFADSSAALAILRMLTLADPNLCLRASVVKLSQPQNVDFPRSPFPLFPSVQNPFKKARESATHVSTPAPSAPKPSDFRSLNLRTVLRTSHQKVDCFPWDFSLGNSLVIRIRHPKHV
jgi:hypothetical protein